MIFTKREASLIRRGKQTSVLAPARKDDLTGRYRPPSRFRVGTDIAVQPGAGLDEVCRVLVSGITLRKLGDLDFLAARSLGFRTQAEMAADWMDRHDDRWPLLEEDICPVCDGHTTVDGEPCPGDCDEVGIVMVPASLLDEQVLDIFRSKHGHKPVWLVTFELPAELPRFLANHSERGYTTRTFDALPGEAEAVDDATLERFARENRAKDEDRQERRRLSERLADLEDDLGVRRQLNAIERRIRAAELARQRKGKAA